MSEFKERSYPWYKMLLTEIINDDLTLFQNQRDCLDLILNMKKDVSFKKNPEALKTALTVSKYARSIAEEKVSATEDANFNDLVWLYLLFEAPYLFESYILYMEKNRPSEKKFYVPRQKTLHIVTQDLQDLEDRKIEFYGLSLPSRVGKSTICLFFMSWIMGRRPNSHNAMGGHSGKLAKGFYSELLNLINTQEYTFREIFPKSKLQKQSADDFEINLGKPDRFATMTCRGIEGTWTGAVDISNDGFLYVDDLVRDRQHSLSPTRLENTYQEYLNKMVDRKIDGARELMVGTRWNLYDPLGKIEKLNKDNPLYRFRKIPALNENNESNFHYDYNVGFSTQYYLDMKARLDSNEWEAKYQQKPFLREGIMFAENELRFYNGILPEGGFIRCISACDVAWGGGDSLSMPLGAEYENGDIYIFDWIFSTGSKEDTLPRVVGGIIGNGLMSVNFEANNGGDMYAQYVTERLQENGYSCSITSTRAPSTRSKKEKINQYVGDIKRRLVFLESSKQSKEYERAMRELTTFVYIGDNLHDDAPDSLTQLIMGSSTRKYAEVTATKNFFWGRR